MKASINLQQTFTDNFLAINPHIQINDLVDYLEPQSFNPETQKIGAIILVNGVATHEVIDFTPEEIAEANKPIIPIQVKNMKFRLALIKSGIMPSSIDSVITQMPEGAMKENIFTLWNFADYLERNDVSLNYMAGQFNITHEQLDNLFILSDTL